jgi:hypothetical protein
LWKKAHRTWLKRHQTWQSHDVILGRKFGDG